jgi:hypothetical protein
MLNIKQKIGSKNGASFAAEIPRWSFGKHYIFFTQQIVVSLFKRR